MPTLVQSRGIDPRLFGRRSRRAGAPPPAERGAGDDLRLFAWTFAAGFLFVSILIV